MKGTFKFIFHHRGTEGTEQKKWNFGMMEPEKHWNIGILE